MFLRNSERENEIVKCITDVTMIRMTSNDKNFVLNSSVRSTVKVSLTGKK
jgi:hypothetical protein